MSCLDQWLEIQTLKEINNFELAKKQVKSLLEKDGIEKQIALALFETPIYVIHSMFGHINGNYNQVIYENDILEKIHFINFFVGHELLDDGNPGFAYVTNHTWFKLFEDEDEPVPDTSKTFILNTISGEITLSKEPLISYSKKIIFHSQDVFEMYLKKAYKGKGPLTREDTWLKSCQGNLQEVLDLINTYNTEYKEYIQEAIERERPEFGISSCCWAKESPYDKLEITWVRDLIKEINGTLGS